MYSNLRNAMLVFMLAFVPIAQAEQGLNITTLEFDYPFNTNDQDAWTGQSFRANNIVSSGQFLGTQALQWGHRKLSLDQGTAGQRALYLLTAGQIDIRFQFANSILFGHEMAHLQSYQARGLRDTAFLDSNNKKVAAGQVYENLFFTFLPKAGAGWLTTPTDPNDLGPYRGVHFGEGLNIQTWFANNRAQELIWQDQSVFAANNYLVNKLTLPGYSTFYTSTTSGNDINSYSTAANLLTGKTITRDDITTMAWLSVALSPTTWSYVKGYYNYVRNGTMTVEPIGVNIAGHKIYWDVPAYLTHNGINLAPMVYLKNEDPEKGLMSEFGLFNKTMFGAGIETTTNGKSGTTDLSFFFKGQIKEKTTVNAYLSGRGGKRSNSGFYSRFGISQAITDKVNINANVAIPTGTTYRGLMLIPHGKTVFWAGINITDF